MKTKIVRLNQIEKQYSLNNEVYAKVESTNPSGSIKDRAVYQMLLDFKNDNKINENTVIVEATSGNTGIALAYYQKEFNYKALIIMPSSMSKQRREMISQYGAELLLLDAGMKECEDKAIELAKINNNYLWLNQFGNKSNPKAHFLNTAPEIEEELDNIDYIFMVFGSGGTISGVGKYFKMHHKDTKIIGIEPFESPLLSKGYASKHLIQGIGANFIPTNLDTSCIDEIITVKGEESIEMAKTIRQVEDIDVGISSGAALLGVINYIKEHKLQNKRIVTIFPDKGDRYSW